MALPTMLNMTTTMLSVTKPVVDATKTRVEGTKSVANVPNRTVSPAMSDPRATKTMRFEPETMLDVSSSIVSASLRMVVVTSRMLSAVSSTVFVTTRMLSVPSTVLTIASRMLLVSETLVWLMEPMLSVTKTEGIQWQSDRRRTHQRSSKFARATEEGPRRERAIA